MGESGHMCNGQNTLQCRVFGHKKVNFAGSVLRAFE
jgi:hypothetical protein